MSPSFRGRLRSPRCMFEMASDSNSSEHGRSRVAELTSERHAPDPRGPQQKEQRIPVFHGFWDHFIPGLKSQAPGKYQFHKAWDERRRLHVLVRAVSVGDWDGRPRNWCTLPFNKNHCYMWMAKSLWYINAGQGVPAPQSTFQLFGHGHAKHRAAVPV